MSLKIDGQRSSQTYGAGGHKRSGKKPRQRVGRAQYVPQQQPTQTGRGVRLLDVAVTQGGDDGRYAYDILRCDCLGDQECVLTPSVTNIPLSFKGADFTIGCWPVIHDDSPDKLKWVETTHARNTPSLPFMTSTFWHFEQSAAVLSFSGLVSDNFVSTALLVQYGRDKALAATFSYIPYT